MTAAERILKSRLEASPQLSFIKKPAGAKPAGLRASFGATLFPAFSASRSLSAQAAVASAFVSTFEFHSGKIKHVLRWNNSPNYPAQRPLVGASAATD